MRQDDRSNSPKSTSTVWSTLTLFGFGVALLGFLVAIDRQEWFHIRPVSGTARAMSFAADRPIDGAKPTVAALPAAPVEVDAAL